MFTRRRSLLRATGAGTALAAGGIGLPALAALAAAATVALAEEKPVALKPGAGLAEVEDNCGVCHSLDYIQMNAPFLNAAGWNAEVTKMIKSFGALIGDTDAKIIVDYLARNYGP